MSILKLILAAPAATSPSSGIGESKNAPAIAYSDIVTSGMATMFVIRKYVGKVLKWYIINGSVAIWQDMDSDIASVVRLQIVMKNLFQKFFGWGRIWHMFPVIVG